jgi:hypothetical protein
MTPRRAKFRESDVVTMQPPELGPIIAVEAAGAVRLGCASVPVAAKSSNAAPIISGLIIFISI